MERHAGEASENSQSSLRDLVSTHMVPYRADRRFPTIVSWVAGQSRVTKDCSVSTKPWQGPYIKKGLKNRTGCSGIAIDWVTGRSSVGACSRADAQEHVLVAPWSNGCGSRWLNVQSGHSKVGMGDRILADRTGAHYGQMLAPAICSCARDSGGPMLCRTVPIAKGNTKRWPWPGPHPNLDNMVPRSYWARSAGGM